MSCLFGISTLNAYADRRSYVWTYEYMTMPKGTKEIEYYLTTKMKDTSSPDINTISHYLEFEYGITDHWDIALYQRIKQDNKKDETDLTYDGFKIRTRYRIGEKGQFFLDPLLYLEYIRDEDFSKPNIVEAKLILAKDIGNLNFAYNQIVKQEVESNGKAEHEYAFGVSYNPNHRFGFGLESKGNYTDGKYYVGPTISFVVKRIWFAFGVVHGLNSKSDDLQMRMIFGIPF